MRILLDTHVLLWFYQDDAKLSRLLVAQAIVEGIPIVTGDDVLHQYPITRIW